MTQKIYVAGHRGMVGSAIVRTLVSAPPCGSGAPAAIVLTRTHAELDLTNQAAVQTFFAAEKPTQVYLVAAKELGMQLRWEGSGVNEVAYSKLPGATIPGATQETAVVQIDPHYFRPIEVETLLGDPSKAKQKLGWVPEITAQAMYKEMVATDLAQAKQHALLKNHGDDVNASVE